MISFFPSKTNNLSNVIRINYFISSFNLQTLYLHPWDSQLNMFGLIVGKLIDEGKPYIQFYINKLLEYNYQVLRDWQMYPRRCCSYELFPLSHFLKGYIKFTQYFSQKNSMSLSYVGLIKLSAP